MRSGLEEFDRRKVRIVDQGIEIVHRRARNVAALEEGQRLGGRERPQEVGDDTVHLIDMPPARSEVVKVGIGGILIEAAETFEEGLPLLVGIDERADVTVAGGVGPARFAHQARIAGFADRRVERAAAEMVAQHELRHGLEHRQLDRLALAGAVAAEYGGEDDVRGVDADDAVDHCQRHIARPLAAGLGNDGRQRADALNEVVISRLAGIGSGVAITHQADVDEPRIDLAHVIVGELEAAHGRRSRIGDENIGTFTELQQRLARRRLLHVENDAALVAIELQIKRAHIGAAGRADALAHEVALRRFDLDHIGAVVGKNLRGVRAGDHRREVEDAQPLQRGLCLLARLG